MTIKTAVGTADDEERSPDPIGTVREEVREDGFFAIWVKVGNAVVKGYGRSEHIWVNEEWICVYSSKVESHGARANEWDVQLFPVVGAVPNTPAHTQRQINAAKDYADVAQRFRRVAQAPARAIVPRLSDKRRGRQQP